MFVPRGRPDPVFAHEVRRCEHALRVMTIFSCCGKQLFAAVVSIRLFSSGIAMLDPHNDVIDSIVS